MLVLDVRNSFHRPYTCGAMAGRGIERVLASRSETMVETSLDMSRRELLLLLPPFSIMASSRSSNSMSPYTFFVVIVGRKRLGNANKDDVDNFDREAMLLLLRLHVAFERDDQRANVVATIIIEVAISSRRPQL